MARRRSPRHGSMQFWPHRRAQREAAKVHSWPESKQLKLLGFLGYKVCMSHVIVQDNRPKALTKDQKVSYPITVIECPPLKVAGITFYKKELTGWRKISSVSALNADKELDRFISIPKKSKSIEDIKEFDDLRLLVYTQPKLTSTGSKRPQLVELALGGSKEEKLHYAKERLGKEIKISEVFEAGNLVDIHSVTKGKGYQGTVKRYGVPIRQHKAEKTKRGIGTLGPWHPNKVSPYVPQPGKMGYHFRTEFNKWILAVKEKPEELNSDSGFRHYGLVSNPCIFLKGSVPGPRKRVLTLVAAIRPNHKIPKEAPAIKYFAK